MSQQPPTPARHRAAIAIARDFCDLEGVTTLELISRSAARPLVAKRQKLYALLVDAGLSAPEVGWLMDRDHSSILHGVEAHRRRALMQTARRVEGRKRGTA